MFNIIGVDCWWKNAIQQKGTVQPEALFAAQRGGASVRGRAKEVSHLKKDESISFSSTS